MAKGISWVNRRPLNFLSPAADRQKLFATHLPLDSHNLGEWPSCLRLLFGFGIFVRPDLAGWSGIFIIGRVFIFKNE